MAIFPLSLRAKRRIFLVCGLAFAFGAAKLWLRFGPEVMSRTYKPGPDFNDRDHTPPGAFRIHARMILKSEFGFPRRLEAFLPAPEKGSSAAAALRAQDFWDGQGWTTKAKELGTVDGRGLRLALGELLLESVDEVTPSRDYNGPQMCQVDYTLRWEAPPAMAKLAGTGNLPGLRLPSHFDFHLPGERRAFQATLVRDGMGWKLEDADRSRAAIPGHPSRGWAWLAPLL